MDQKEPERAGPAPEPQPTVTSIGSYKLLEPLGSGGMSSVFRARHLESSHIVAVKVLPRSLAKNTTLLQRFLREAKNAELLQHQNIVAIFDRGMEAGRYYLVMEYVGGGDLQERVRVHGALPWPDAVAVVREVAEGLRYAASQGLIHRDIKPANLLVTKRGRIKVADLGLALQLDEEDERVTRDGTTVGTVDYMAPEQARDSRGATVKSDIYSLGCTFYYLLTGIPPFVGGDIAEKLRHHATSRPPELQTFVPEAPVELADLLSRMMAKKPEARFPDYNTLLAALEALPVPRDPSARLAAIVDDDSGPLAALIDEEEPGPLAALIDEESPGPLAALLDHDESGPLAALIDEDTAVGTPESPTGPLAAIVDDEEALTGDDGYVLGASRTSGPTPARGTTVDLGLLPEIEPIPLEPLDQSSTVRRTGLKEANAHAWLAEPDAIPGKLVPPTAPRTQPAATVREISSRGTTVDPYADLPGPQLPEPSHLDSETRVNLLRGLLAASLLVLAVVAGWAMFRGGLFSPARPTRPGVAEHPADEEVASRTAPTGIEVATAKDLSRSKSAPPRSGAGGDSIPTPPEPVLAPEPAIPAELWDRVGLKPPTASPTASAGATGVLRVRRVGLLGETDFSNDLERALADRSRSVIEIIDTGPFYLDQARLGLVRTLRAAPGVRPILVILPSRSTAASERLGIFQVESDDLLLEGLDLVVDISNLPPTSRALFHCVGAGVTLRDCTITVVGSRATPWHLIQVGEEVDSTPPASSRITIERTWIRGAGGPLLALFAAADVFIDRAAMVAGKGPTFLISGEPKAARSIAISRSILASGGSILELAGSAGSKDASAPVVRVLASTLARMNASPSADLITLRDVPDQGTGGDRTAIEWHGEANHYIGFQSWLAPGTGGTAGILDLEAARTIWNGGDQVSTEDQSGAWSVELGEPWIAPELLRTAAPDRAWLVDRLPRPSPALEERSIGRFPLLPSDESDTESSPSPTDIAFDVSNAPWNGDLGLFLASLFSRSSGPQAVRVRAQGKGRHAMTPFVLPPDCRLEISVVPESGTPLAWSPIQDAAGDALFTLSPRSSLRLENVRLQGHSASKLSSHIQVDDATLRIRSCWLTTPSTTGEERLLRIKSSGSAPVSATRVDVVDSLIQTGGTAIAIDISLGSLRLENALVIAGGAALEIAPPTESPERYAVELAVERSTLVAERDLVRLVARKNAIRPNRPLVIHSRQSMWSDSFDWGPTTPALGVLFRTDPEAFARGALVWQSERDAYDVSRFILGGDAPPDPSRTIRPDVMTQWVDFWGPSHVTDAVGPTVREQNPPIRLKTGRLTPGRVDPSRLEVAQFAGGTSRPVPIGADLARIGLSTANPTQGSSSSAPKNQPSARDTRGASPRGSSPD
jgi:serine/threonine-protein kinase